MTPGELLLQALDTSVALFPHATSLLFERARLLDGRGDAAGAEAAYRAVIARDPRHFRALNDLGLLQYRQGRAVDALMSFLAAVDADDANAAGHANLGVMLLTGDDLAGARAEFERALALAPDQPTAVQGLRAVHERLGIAAPVPPAVAAVANAATPAIAGGTAPPDPFVEYAFEVAANAIAAGDHDAARAFVDAIAGDEPRFATLVWRLADLAGSVRAFDVARAWFDRAIALDPANIDARIGRAIVLEEMGDLAAADAAWHGDALRGAVRLVPYRGTGEPVRLLTIASALHAIRYELFADATLMRNAVLYTQAYDPAQPLPEHDVVLVAVADVESDGPALDVAAAIVQRTSAPVLNAPARVRQTSRTEQAQRLAALDGVAVARVTSVSRDALLREGAAAAVERLGYTYPLLMRSPGFHNGRFFEFVRDAGELEAVTRTMPRDDVLLISYEDTRGTDGMVRKFRVMTIGGELYPVHLAISPNWKVHYVSSAMAGNAAFRAEEAAFLNDMPGVLGARAMDALRAIAATMGLDYGGIDFGLAPDGRVVVFEANGAMAIFVPDADPRWDYRRPAMTAALRAATQMIVERGTAYRTKASEWTVSPSAH
jgi:tetratricopeptide (TPR) repeat protein